MPDLSIIVPSLHITTSARALKVFLSCLVDNTSTAYELLLSSHDDKDTYVSFNELASQARGKYLALLNDDIFMSPGWDTAFMEQAKADRLLIGCLVESGIKPVHPAYAKHDYGTTPEEFQRESFEKAIARHNYKINNVPIWGVPWLVEREAFLDLGGFETKWIGKTEGYSLDQRFYDKWRDLGLETLRVGAWGYHLMSWSFRDYAFGKKRSS